MLSHILTRTTLALALLTSSKAFAESALVRTLETARKTVISVKGDLKPTDVRKNLLDFLHDDLSDGIREINNELSANPALARENYPRGNEKINRALEKILGSAYLNLQGDVLLSDTIIFENASAELQSRFTIVRKHFEGLRDLYFGNDIKRITFYRKYAYVRFTLKALTVIRENVDEALEYRRNDIKPVKDAVKALDPIARSALARLASRANYERNEDIIAQAKRDVVESKTWSNLKLKLKDISLSGGFEMEGNYKAAFDTLFYMELLKHIWEKQL